MERGGGRGVMRRGGWKENQEEKEWRRSRVRKRKAGKEVQEE